MVLLGDDEGASTSQGDEATFQEAFAYLEGGFGRVEIGGTDGAAFKMHYSSPWFVPGNGVDSPNIYNAGTTVSSPSTYALATEDAPKVSYFTPRLSGFQLGVSYTPDAGVHDPYANGWGVSPTNSSLEEVFEVAANYAGEIGSVELGVDVFYVTGDAGATPALDPEEMGVGASLGFAGFTLGGAYKTSDELSGGYLTSTGVEETVWTVGLAYGTGPWTVGVAYIESELENGTAEATTDMLQVGGGYSLGAGVDLGLDIQFINNESSTAGVTTFEDEATSAGVVLAISF
jgi:outer membrane protein OmpU